MCPHSAHLECLGTTSDSACPWPDPQAQSPSCPINEEAKLGGGVPGGVGAGQLVPASRPRRLLACPLQASRDSALADQTPLAVNQSRLRLGLGHGHVSDTANPASPRGPRGLHMKNSDTENNSQAGIGGPRALRGGSSGSRPGAGAGSRRAGIWTEGLACGPILRNKTQLGGAFTQGAGA